ncbi:hypothetical protein Tco_0717793 [Tanacetum coccineum]
METEAIDNHANLVNYDNENEYEIEDLGYESEEYTEDDENNHSNSYAKRGITRLCKFRREYGKPGGDDMVRGTSIYWFADSNPGTNGASPEARNKLGNELTASNSAILEKPKIGVNFETTRPSKRNLSITNLTPLRFGACQGGNLLKLKMARFQVCFSAYNGEWICTCEEENGLKKKEIEQDKESTRGTLWLKGRVNKDGEYQDDEIRSVGMYILVDQGTDAMTLVLGKEKGGYARGVGSGVTYKRYFAIPKRQKVVMYDFVLESQLDWLARPTDPIDSRCLRWKFYQNSSVMRGAEKTFLDCDQEWMRAFGRKCKKKEVTLVDETQEMNDDNLMFDADVLEEQEKDVAEKEVSTVDPVTTAGEVVTTANVEVSTVKAPTTTIDELTLAQTLIKIKAAKPKAVTSAATTTTTTNPRLEGYKLIKEERLARQKEEEANIALLESWDNTQAMMEADFELSSGGNVLIKEMKRVKTLFVDMNLYRVGEGNTASTKVNAAGLQLLEELLLSEE